jgi:hypothetical protein
MAKEEKEKKGFYINSKRVPSISTLLSGYGFGKDVLNSWAFGEGKTVITKAATKILFDLDKQSPGKLSVEEAVIRIVNEAEPIKLKDITDISKQDGLCFHSMMESFIKNTPFDSSEYDPRVIKKMEKFYVSFLAYLKTTNVSFPKSEFDVLSPAVGYGCRVDFEMIEDGRLKIGDFKTGKDVYTDHLLQESACFYAYGETFGKFPDSAVVFVVNKSDSSGTILRAEFCREELAWGYEVVKVLKNLYQLSKGGPALRGRAKKVN